MILIRRRQSRSASKWKRRKEPNDARNAPAYGPEKWELYSRERERTTASFYTDVGGGNVDNGVRDS